MLATRSFLALHLREPFVPSAFELGANEAVRRVDGVILATSQVRLVPRLGQRQFRVVAPVGVLLVAHRYRLRVVV